MCLFSGAVPHVSGTRIYAGPRDEGASIHQRIAYQMTAAVPDSLAMVLPIPTPPNPPEDAVTFVDFSSCPAFFTQLDALFPVETMAFGGAPLARGGYGPPQTLVVHDVGDFEASFVPSLRDFARLDARFRMPDSVWSQLPQYADWSFCVFKLRGETSEKKSEKKKVSRFWEFFRGDESEPAAPQPSEPNEPKKRVSSFWEFFRPDGSEQVSEPASEPASIGPKKKESSFWRFFTPDPAVSAPSLAPRKRHPMAFDFPRRDPSKIFFPTVHVHDGEVHPIAQFDHTLYAQLDNPATPGGWEPAQMGTDLLYDAAKKFVRPERPMFRKRIQGDHPNVDVTL